MKPIRITLAASLLLIAAASLFAADKGVAIIGKQTLSQAELDQAVGTRLMRLRTEEYNIRKTALDDLIAERLLATEAARRNITVEELLKTEVGGKIEVPTAAEVEPFYDGTKERFGGSKEEAIAQIIEGMKRQRIAARTAEFVKSLREAAGVKVLLAPPRAKVDAAGPTRGSEVAPVTIVEFSDFECPFCSRANATMKKIEQKYGENVKFVFLDYPLPIHRTAPRAAAAARCAADQGKFWEMHDRFFSKNGGPVQDADIRKYATESGVDMTRFSTCLDSGKYADTWKEGQAAGSKVGVQSTPTFFVNGRMVVGAAPLESFTSVIDEELARTKKTAAAAATGR
ncbi:MAG TPA: thioredoxin domain-containing protein [Thermoanaerobaculia bacterium]|nr:thioredoxin domain-containing protein [Thermoanaerobaculia bacterium]